jgi:60S ribosome subunit biogenesis protein NIP7
MSTQAHSTHRALQVWIKPNGEMPYLYGNHVVKAHLGRITEDTPEHQGVVIFSMNDTPLGFGVTAKSSVDSRKLDPTGILVYNQACAHPCTYTD